MKQLKNELNISLKEILTDAGYYVISEIEYLEKEEGIDCYVAINYKEKRESVLALDMIMSQIDIFVVWARIETKIWLEKR